MSELNINQFLQPHDQDLLTDLSKGFSDFVILIVDGSRTPRKILARELNKLDLNNILEANNGIEALEVIRSQKVDLVLSALEMPELDGLGFLENLKNDETYKSIPVIVVSGAEEGSKTIKCIELGAEDFLPKPYDPVLLKARIFSSLEKKRLRNLEIKNLALIKHEKELSDSLMLNILPFSIAQRLKNGEQSISNSYENATILFADIVSFTAMSAKRSAHDLVILLNDLFSRFDACASNLGVEKIKTIGDCYMAAGGIPDERSDHAEIVADFALKIVDEINIFNAKNNVEFFMRIGINSGPLVAGVMGTSKFCYDIWGHAVNTASRMESTSLPNRIQVSPSTQTLLKGKFLLEKRDLIECKGLGKILTHFVNGRI